MSNLSDKKELYKYEYRFNGQHEHLLCISCKSTIKYNNFACFICQVKRKDKDIYLHHFIYFCEINNCNKIKSHEHYLCNECNEKRKKNYIKHGIKRKLDNR